MLPIPGMTILAPRDLSELRAMIRWSGTFEAPLAIRYGKQSVDLSEHYPCHEYTLGKWEQMEQGSDCVLLAVGSMVEPALEVRELLAKHHIDAEVVNCSTVKPMDEDALRRLASKPMITMEEHVLTGGFGSAVSSFCVSEELQGPIMSFGIPDMYVQHGRRDQLLKYLGLTPRQMAQRIRITLEEREEHER